MSEPRRYVPLPPPPRRLRIGPFREGAFSGALHDPRTATVVGRLLGVAFAVCLATGLWSHVLQHQPAGLTLPTRPSWGYAFTQGLHVTAGIVAIVLLPAKLWVVYPRLFAWPPARSVVHLAERGSVAVLVAAALFELGTGLINTVGWYPWPFPFVPVHYWTGWIVTGALLLHVAVKLPVIRDHFLAPESGRTPPDGPSRRGFLAVIAGACGLVTVTTAGQSLAPLRPLALLAPRRTDLGPQGLPVNRTAGAAQVLDTAPDPAWRLEVTGPRPYTLDRAQLLALPQVTRTLPIACVEGWTAVGRWTGVRLRDLTAAAGAPRDAAVRVVSLEKAGPYAVTTMAPEFVRDPSTLLALRLEGQDLDLEHGYPARIIAPNRPGVLQTKWVVRLEVLP